MFDIGFDLRITVSATKTSPVWWSYFFIVKNIIDPKLIPFY
jgi:hypothetical protein